MYPIRAGAARSVSPSSAPCLQAASDAAPARLQKHDLHLRRFEFSRALDDVLEREVTRRRPELTMAVMAELQRRGALAAAVAGRHGASLRRLCNFLGKQLARPHVTGTAAEAAGVVADVYADRTGCGDPDVDLAIDGLRAALDRHLAYLDGLWTLKGGLDMLLAAAAAGDGGGTPAPQRLQVETS